jgi:hypothetical protein
MHTKRRGAASCMPVMFPPVHFSPPYFVTALFSDNQTVHVLVIDLGLGRAQGYSIEIQEPRREPRFLNRAMYRTRTGYARDTHGVYWVRVPGTELQYRYQSRGISPYFTYRSPYGERGKK